MRAASTHAAAHAAAAALRLCHEHADAREAEEDTKDFELRRRRAFLEA
jgi:hypothetical protein